MSATLPPRRTRILVIDDNPSIHDDFRKILGPAQPGEDVMFEAEASLFGDKPIAEVEARVRFEIDSAYQGQEGLARVEGALEEGRPYAMAFVDVRMPPGWDGVETITRLWKVSPELQVVICTAYSDYSWEDILKRVGSTDSLVILKKPFDNVEVLQLAHALTTKWHLTRQAKERLVELDRTVNQRTQELQATNARLQQEIVERARVDAALQLSQERFSKAFRATPIPMAILTTRQERYVHVNDAFVNSLEFTPEELVGQAEADLRIWSEPQSTAATLVELRQRGSIRSVACKLKSKSGRIRDVFLSAELLNLGGEANMLLIAEDVSERLHLEKRLQEAQKMEAVGQLAAGVAHDFNNILTIIQGHVNLQLGQAGVGPHLAASLHKVADAAERAASLTRQLLAFSSKQVVQPTVLDLNQSVNRMHSLFGRVIGEQITLRCDCADGLPAIEADESSLDQVLMNLVVNARDAMSQGGQLWIRTQAVELADTDAKRHPLARSGRFVCLSVQDEGGGIKPATLDRIFEPFFTTKELGKGTGLGLSTAFGIVKQHGGWIEVQSEVGRGSTFSVFLPRSTKCLQLPLKKAEPRHPLRGQETVLLVEDEDLLRELQRQVMEHHGYRVVEAADAVQALTAWDQHDGAFDVLVTDVVMPNGMNGLELGQRLQESKPELKLIFTSGYNSKMAGKDFRPTDGCAYLQKPYKPDQLLQTLRSLLDEGPVAGLGLTAADLAYQAA